MGNCVWNNCRWLFRCISIRGGRAIMIILLIIIGMSLVTMIPRVIPAFVVGQLEFKSWLNRWLNAIPYAALGALIFPGIMTVIPERPFVGLMGGVVALIIAFFNINVIFAVLGAIFTVFFLTM